MPQALDKDGLQEAKTALKNYLNTQTVFGFNVGAHATDDELTIAATTTLQAYLDFISAPKL